MNTKVTNIYGSIIDLNSERFQEIETVEQVKELEIFNHLSEDEKEDANNKLFEQISSLKEEDELEKEIPAEEEENKFGSLVDVNVNKGIILPAVNTLGEDTDNNILLEGK